VTGLSSGNYAGPNTNCNRRDTFVTNVTRWVNDRVGISHALKAGMEIERGSGTTWSGIPGGRLYQDANGKASQVVYFNGQTTNATSRRNTFFVQDTWTVVRNLTVEPGIRYSQYRGSIPMQSDVFSTNMIDPRIGAAWDILGDHKTLLRVHYGWSHDQFGTGQYGYLDFSNWSPRITYGINANGSLTYKSQTVQPGNIVIDPNVKQPSARQFTIAFEREIFPDFGVTVQYVHRNYQDILAVVDSGSQWQAVQKQDPGQDNVLGTADDGQMLTVYSLLNPGKIFFTLTNPGDATRNYDAFMLIAKKRFSHNWQMQVSYTHSKSMGQVDDYTGTNIGTFGDTAQTGEWANPNARLNAYGVGSFAQPENFLFSGTYRLPSVKYVGGATISANYRVASGAPYGRLVTIRGLAQGNQSVRVESRSTYRCPVLNQFDMRFEKTFPIGSARRTAGVYVDVFNLPNAGYATAITENAGTQYGIPAGWAPGRSFQVGVRVAF
jgi:hypothetical protein